MCLWYIKYQGQKRKKVPWPECLCHPPPKSYVEILTPKLYSIGRWRLSEILMGLMPYKRGPGRYLAVFTPGRYNEKSETQKKALIWPCWYPYLGLHPLEL